uniref:Cornulin n=1 Tax=Nannospalax galili TaxID=1026970 RepID=A0A8C6QRA9_NANGA
MPQLLRNIHGLIEAFRRYATSEGGCTALTRREMKRLLEHELADVIVKPHDPATVDEVLRLLDEDNTGTVEFKEFLVLVFKIAQACFKTLNESPSGPCRSQESESCHPRSSTELEQGRRSGTEVGRDGRGQHHEGSGCGQSDQASRGQGRVGTHTQGQESYSIQVSNRGRQAESQRQEMVSQWTRVIRPVEQTPRIEDKSQTRERRSERQSWTSQQTDETMTGTTTQTKTGASQTQGSTCSQNRGTKTYVQDRSQASQATTGHNQAQAESYTQTQTQMVEQSRSQQTGNTSIQTQESIYDQTRGTEPHGQDRSQAGQAATGHFQIQMGPHTQTHTQIVEQSWNQQTGNTSIQTQGSTCGQNRGTETHGQDWSQAGQAATGHFQTQAGPYSQTVEQDRSRSASQKGVQEQGQTQMQSGMGQRWAQVSNYEVGEPVLGGQVQTRTRTVMESQGRQEERVPTVVRDEWVDDHTRELVIRSQDPGSLHSGSPSAQIQGTAQMEEKKGIVATGLYSYLKSGKP